MPDIRERLLGFYDNNYSSNVMSMCLVGNHSVDTLQDMAIEHFAEIEDKKLLLTDYTKGEDLYDETTLGHMVKIVPIKDLR